MKFFPANGFFKFLVVGAVNTLLVYLIYAVFIFFGFGYAVAQAIALVFGIITGYKAQSRFVFRESGSFFTYVAIWIFLYLVNIFGIGLLIQYGAGSYLAGALMIPPMAGVSFVLQKFFVFKAATRN